MPIYLIINKKQVVIDLKEAAGFCKMVAIRSGRVPQGNGSALWKSLRCYSALFQAARVRASVLRRNRFVSVLRNRRKTGFQAFGDPGSSFWRGPCLLYTSDAADEE